MIQNDRESGSLLVTTLTIMMFLMIIILSLMLLSQTNLSRAQGRLLLLQAQYSAETGADVALSKLNNGAEIAYAYAGETDFLVNGGSYRSTYEVKMDDGSDVNEKIITAIGRTYAPSSSTTPKFTRTLSVTANRSTTTSGASIISRNIVRIGSSVKEITGKNIFVNEYIQMDKNTNVFTVENLTVAGTNGGAGNCSVIGGSLERPPLPFANIGQTKTAINLAGSNCSPIGNVAEFDVTTNRTDLEEVQSTMIPWSYVMNSSDLSAGSCSDWTSGASPRIIPSVGNENKTHYPNSLNGIAVAAPACGTSGTLNLGSASFTITDDVHIRANLCTIAMGCQPTFTNPTATMKYIFVEGSLAFKGVTVPASSGPIVFVVYGDTTDPIIAGSCPTGGAVYLGGVSSQTVTATKAYFIAVNGGFCIDKVKLPELGGISGKNVYIATQSGNPFSLSFDPTFPVEQIPVNLSWKATLYEQVK